jgi:hypothetical protein
MVVRAGTTWRPNVPAMEPLSSTTSTSRVLRWTLRAFFFALFLPRLQWSGVQRSVSDTWPSVASAVVIASGELALGATSGSINSPLVRCSTCSSSSSVGRPSYLSICLLDLKAPRRTDLHEGHQLGKNASIISGVTLVLFNFINLAIFPFT